MIKDFEEKVERGEIPLPTIEDLQKLKSSTSPAALAPTNGEVAVLPAPPKEKKKEKNGGGAA
jgi:hypothetical protein